MTHQSLEQYLPHSVVANHDVQENPGPKVKVLNTRSFHSSMKPTAAAAATPLYLRRFALALRPYSALQSPIMGSFTTGLQDVGALSPQQPCGCSRAPPTCRSAAAACRHTAPQCRKARLKGLVLKVVFRTLFSCGLLGWSYLDSIHPNSHSYTHESNLDS